MLGKAQAARASGASAPDVRYRVPTGADLKSLQSSGLLDEAGLEEAVRRALRRMDLDFALRTGAEEVMGRLFPGHGAFDEAAAASIFGTSPEDVYGSVAQEEAKPKPEDKARLKAVGRLALREMQAAKNDDEGLRDVFGKKASVAKARYAKGKAALSKALAHIDTALTSTTTVTLTRFNLAAWAMFSKQHIQDEGQQRRPLRRAARNLEKRRPYHPRTEAASPHGDRKLMDWLVAHYKVPWLRQSGSAAASGRRRQTGSIA
jgi:hypothetical protein